MKSKSLILTLMVLVVTGLPILAIAEDQNDVQARQLLTYVRLGEIEKVKILVEKRPWFLGIGEDKARVAKSEDGRQMLHWAVEKGHTDLVKFLIDKGVDVKAAATDGRTPLHCATTRMSLESAKMLVAKGADVNAKSKDGRMPLHYVAYEGDIEVAKFLIDNGAETNVMAKDGRTPLHWAKLYNTEVAELLQKNGSTAKYNFGIWGIIPALVAIGFAIFSKRVIESLLLGILSGALMLDANINGWGHSLRYSMINLIKAIAGHSANEATGLKGMGLLQDPERPYLLFGVLLLGALIATLDKSGGAMAFGNWVSKRVKSEKGVQNCTVMMGFSLFTSAYFSSLATGTVFRPLYDKMNMSRAKLGFLINSTSAPAHTLIPFSGWVAYMSMLMSDNIPGCKDGFKALVQTVPFNLYCIFMFIFSILLANGLIKDFGLMKKFVDKAKTGEDLSRNMEGTPEDHKKREEAELKLGKEGKVSDMLVPLIVSVVTLLVTALWNYTVVEWFPSIPIIPLSGNQLLIVSFVLGILTGFVKHAIFGKVKIVQFLDNALNGSKTSIMAGMMIILAITLGDLIRCPAPEGLGTAAYLGELGRAYIPGSVVPASIFVLACFISFSAGTSWGTWAICMPIAVPLAAANGGNPYLAAAAVLSGGAFGDQCSPISNTTIMSSLGSGCNLIDLIRVQIPYGVVVAIIAAGAFLVAGFIF